MKIMMGLDGSQNSKAAVAFVKRFPWPAGTRVSLVSVATVPREAYTDIYVGAGSAVADAWAEKRYSCHGFVASAKQELESVGLETSTQVPIGDPRRELVDAILDEHPDLLILGSHDQSSTFHANVAAHAVMNAPCNVLVVKEPRRK